MMADAAWDGDAEEENRGEMEQEVELLQAMYTPEELSVEPRDQETGKDAAVVLEVALENVRATFRFELPERFPMAAPPRVSLARSRGLVDSEEADMCKRLEAQIAETHEAMGRYSLVDLLLLAKDLVQECSDQGGTCAICLCELDTDDAPFRASCWHTFHRACFAAWFKQVEARRTQAGTAHSQASLQRKQALSAMTARVAERQRSVTKAEDRVQHLRAEKERFEGLADHLAAGGEAANYAQVGEGEAELTEGAARKRAAAMDAEAKRVRGEVGVTRSKLHKATEELAAMQSIYDAQASLEEQQGLDCPMCKLPIAHEEFCDALADAVPGLLAVGDDGAGTLLPRAWSGGGTASGLSESLFSSEDREALARQAAERQALFEAQRLKGGIIEESEAAGDFVIIDGQTETPNGATPASDAAAAPAPAPAQRNDVESKNSGENSSDAGSRGGKTGRRSRRGRGRERRQRTGKKS